MARHHLVQPPAVHERTPLLPSLLLALAPLCDLVRLITSRSSLSLLAFYFTFFGTIAAAVVVLPELIDWLAADRHSAARRAATTPLLLRLGALAPLSLGAFVRLRGGAARFDGWTCALALAGALAWLVGAERRRHYQPIGLPLSC